MNYKIVLSIILCCLFVSCSKTPQTEQTVIFVKIPPIYNDKLSQEENYYRFRHFLFPQEETPNPIPEGLPNDDSLLFVSIDKNGKIKLNSENTGDVSEIRFLQERLTKLFQERKEAGVYETHNWKVVKAVGIKADSSIKYSDFMKVLEAVKQSGAEPIVLLFENDARPKAKFDLSTGEEIKN
ncbi:MAG: ExbD/TolR family protein [Aridibacter sp.]